MKTTAQGLPEGPLDEFSGCPNMVAMRETPDLSSFCISRHGEKPGVETKKVMTLAAGEGTRLSLEGGSKGGFNLPCPTALSLQHSPCDSILLCVHHSPVGLRVCFPKPVL